MASDAAGVDRARKLRLPRVSDVVLTHLASCPAGDVEESVIQGEVDVGHHRRHCAKPLQEGWQLVLGRRFGRDRRRLLDVELAVFAPPSPDRAFEVCGVDHDAQEPVLAYRIVRGSHLERHLVVRAKIDRLDVVPGPEIPKVDPMAILSGSHRPANSAAGGGNLCRSQKTNRGEGGRIRIRDQPHAPSTTQRRMVLRS
jgi:hypothetical protein